MVRGRFCEGFVKMFFRFLVFSVLLVSVLRDRKERIRVFFCYSGVGLILGIRYFRLRGYMEGVIFFWGKDG